MPAFTSPAQAAATAGLPLLFTVTTAGSPLSLTTLARSGTLPPGVTFLSLGNGTATFAGIPTGGGKYPITLTAKNSAGTTTQMFVLNVSAAPVITTGANATATVGSAFSYTVKASGAPTPTLAEAGILPPGLTWVDNGNGTATLAGVPNLGGSYKLTVSASSASRHGHPGVHADGRPGPGYHQRGECGGDPRHAVQLHLHLIRLPALEPGPHRERAWPCLHQYRQRDR